MEILSECWQCKGIGYFKEAMTDENGNVEISKDYRYRCCICKGT